MPSKVGDVQCVNVGDDYAFTRIRPAGERPEALILWLNPQVTSTATRMQHSMWISLLRTAMAHGMQVRVTHGENSAFVQLVELRGPSF